MSLENNTSYLPYHTIVNWGENVRKFWKIHQAADLHRYFNISLHEYTDNESVDVKNDIFVFRPHVPIDEKIFELLDKGMRFIIDCMWEYASFIFETLHSYSSNGIALIAGNSYPLEYWPNNRTYFVPMSFWYIEFFRMLNYKMPNLTLKLNFKNYDFLMPINRRKPYRELFLHFLEPSLHKGLYSIIWKNKFLPYSNELDFKKDEMWDLIPPIDKCQRTTFHEDRHYDPQWYISTYYSMVVETLQDWDAAYITEKTMKPIMYGHPFMIYGPPGILKVLRDNGFHTFPEIFDESYDLENNLIKRTILIANQVEQFNHQLIYDNKHVINQKIFDNFNRFYNKDIVLASIDKNIRQPIEKFIYEK